MNEDGEVAEAPVVLAVTWTPLLRYTPPSLTTVQLSANPSAFVAAHDLEENVYSSLRLELTIADTVVCKVMDESSCNVAMT